MFVGLRVSISCLWPISSIGLLICVLCLRFLREFGFCGFLAICLCNPTLVSYLVSSVSAVHDLVFVVRFCKSLQGDFTLTGFYRSRVSFKYW